MFRRRKIARTVLIIGFITSLVVVSSAQEFSAWSPAVNVGPVVNTTANDQHPTLSKDGLTMVFVSTRLPSSGGNDLWVTERDSLDDPWQPPVNLAFLNSPGTDFAPEFSTDGHWLFFHSDRTGGPGCGGTDIYAAHRKNKKDSFGWDEIVHLGCTLNTPASEAGPTVFQDPETGVFTMYMNRNLNIPPDTEGYDIYSSTCVADLSSCNRDQLWTAPVLVPELSMPGFRDTRTAIRRRDGLEMILTSSRPHGCGGQDLWVSTRPTTADVWSIPVNLDPINPATGVLMCTTNSGAVDGAMAISWDGTEMYFFSNRSTSLGGNDLYRTTRTKLTGSEK